MKKVVNGRLFDTSEAISVVSWTASATVFGIDVEVKFTLFREKVAEKPMDGLKLTAWGGVSDWDVETDVSKGGFFLATQLGGDYSGSGRIRPLSVDEAKRVFEEHTDSDYDVEDKYAKYFGVRPQKPVFDQLKEAFAAGAAAKQKQYEEAEAARRKNAATPASDIC